jgi:hypothetical protein
MPQRFATSVNGFVAGGMPQRFATSVNGFNAEGRRPAQRHAVLNDHSTQFARGISCDGICHTVGVSGVARRISIDAVNE